ncbi:Cys-tRNA(Pro) deacylase [Ornithinibacter aureus]|uniref:Cys-tRNA(Pro)/Cys-tRNA(Cys) deacylase n=1 Tax=Ornithinibacter aureus TaxID=622664 RepID=A0ABP8JAG3_9MICO|nr:Cys-tRNA(Pro) deacylase [Ornithinibacter aureus]KAF0832792.1 transcriptional regulator [Ornithinibacter aureus]
MPRREPSGTPATVTLTAAGVPFSQHAYEHDPAARSYGQEAVDALGLPAEQMFKTLLVDTGAGLAVAVVPVAGSLDLKAMATALGVKRVGMADPAAAQRSSGYVLGGISPVGQKRPLPTVIDGSAELFDVVYVSGGRRGFDIGLAPADLVRVTGAVLADIAR